jgi:multiple sugar transport system permease protein
MKGLGKTTFQILDNPFQNYSNILSAPTFQKAMFNTAILWLINFLPQILLALVLTAWFTNQRRKIKGQGIFKVLFYMPNIITAATIAILFGSLFGYPIGPVNSIMKSLGIISEPVFFLQDKWLARGIVSFIQFWMWYGNTMIVLIAGVLGINPEIFQAAEIDGANGVQTFFYITLPNLRTILLYTLVTSLIGGLQMFDIPKLFLNGGPDSATLTTSVFIYNQAFSGSYMYNRASAASMIMFVIIVALACVLFYTMRDRYAAKQRKIEKAVARAERKERRENHENR